MYFTKTLSFSLVLFTAGTIASPITINIEKPAAASQIATQCEKSDQLFKEIKSSTSSEASKAGGGASNSMKNAINGMDQASANAQAECQKMVDIHSSGGDTFAKTDAKLKAAFRL